MKGLQKRFWFEVALCASFFNIIHSSTAYSIDTNADSMISATSTDKIEITKEAYTVNFNNISMIEFIRFVSKITELNFVFEEGDLQFAVTIVSEEPISAKNITSVLAQVLRIHGLILLEQENNILITKNIDVNQIPTIISSDMPDADVGNTALVTQVFRIKNTNVVSIANIIRPMISKSALLEISVETHQLIVTDITTNVEKIATLLNSLDTPHTSLDIETYTVRHIAPSELIELTQQILRPFTEGTPLIFVPQIDTNSVFIVSTPHLIERSLTVMEDLDLPTKAIVVGQKIIPGKNIFIYQPTNRTPNELLTALSQVSGELQSTPGADTPLEIAIHTARVINDTRSLLFLAEADTVTSLKELLLSLDTKTSFPGVKNHFLIYTPQYHSGQELLQLVHEVATNLKNSHLANPSFLSTIESVKWISSNNLLVFTGDPQSIERITAILKTIDITESYNAKASQVFVYRPQYTSHTEIQSALTRLMSTLDRTAMPDLNLSKAIDTMEWNSDTQSFIVTSDALTIERLQKIFISLDNPEQLSGKTAQNFFLYKLQHTEGNLVLKELDEIARQIPQTNVQNQSIVNAIEKMQWIDTTNSLLITGSNSAIEQIKTLLADLDVTNGTSAKSSFLLYKPQRKTPEDLLAAIPELQHHLQTSGLVDAQLFDSLSSMTYTPDTESLIFTGSKETLAKVQDMLQKIENGDCNSHIQCLGPTTFLIYPLQHVSGDQLAASMKNFAQHLHHSNIDDKALATALDDMRYIRETHSVLFIAPKETLEQIDQLIPKFDIASLAKLPPPERPSATYIVYSPRYLSGQDLIAILNEFAHNLEHSGVADAGLFDVITNLKWIDTTSTLLVSGHADAVAKVQDLLQKFDIPSKTSGSDIPSIEDIDNTSFLVYKLQYHQGSDIRDALKQVGSSLTKTSTTNHPPLIEAINSLQWIQVTNSLLATGEQSVLVKLKNLIENLDVPLRQVFVEVLVIETSMGNTQNFGLMWGSQVQYMNKTILSTGNFPISGQNSTGNTPVSTFAPLLQGINATTTPAGGATGVPFTSGFDLGVIGDIIMHKGKSFISLGSLVNALQLDTNSTIVMNPKIITQDNQQSIIFVGSNVPYTGAIVSTVGSGTQQTTSNIEYRDVGVSLTITPILGDNDIVTLDVVHDISEVVGNTNSTSNNQLTGITTTHTHMETRVHVPNKHFVALSGMITDTKTRYRTSIPCLGGLPVIGALFSETDRSDTKQNIIIFMRPFIISSYEEYKTLTEHQEWTYKDQVNLPVLKEDFDAALDIVKTPENE